MIDSVQDAVDRIYVKGDEAFYTTKCSEALTLPEELMAYLQDRGLSVIEFYTAMSSWPSKKWIIRFPKVVKGEFEVEFRTVLMMSKLALVHFVQHEFSVENEIENKIAPSLEGFSGQPYSTAQFELDDLLSRILSQKGYRGLSDAMMREVICELKVPEGITIFGPQVTVEYALFNDLLGLCSS